MLTTKERGPAIRTLRGWAMTELDERHPSRQGGDPLASLGVRDLGASTHHSADIATY
jgi:hypothetical protein